MGEVLLNLLRWTAKLSFIIGLILATLVLLGVITTYMVVGFNTSVLNDIFGVLQIWLPFNLNILLIWITVATTAYLAWRLSLMAYNILDAYLGR